MNEKIREIEEKGYPCYSIKNGTTRSLKSFDRKISSDVLEHIRIANEKKIFEDFVIGWKDDSSYLYLFGKVTIEDRYLYFYICKWSNSNEF